MDKKYLYMKSHKKIVEDCIIAIEQHLSEHQNELPEAHVKFLKKQQKALKNVLDDSDENTLNSLFKNPVVQMTFLKLIDWLMK